MSLDASKVLVFSRLLGALKALKRTGWVKREVGEPVETVAGHMYRMAALALLLPKDGLDRDRAIRICLVHDMGEAIVGDVTPFCGVSAGEKEALERAAIERLAGLVGEEVGQELRGLWEEYEAGQTPEARAVKQLDKFDMIAQAAEYEEREAVPGRLEEFFASTKDEVFEDDFGVGAWRTELHRQRDARKVKAAVPKDGGNGDRPRAPGEEAQGREARAVRQLDKLCMIPPVPALIPL